MRNLLRVLSLALAALLPSSALFAQGSIVGPANAVLCNNAALLPVGTTGLTKVITGVQAKTIYVCGWHVTNTAATGTFSVSIGSGANCGSNTVSVITALNVTSTAPSSDHVEYATLSTPAAGVPGTAVPPSLFGTPYDLCVNPSVTTIAIVIWYSQF